jgi:hypothetical protein
MSPTTYQDVSAVVGCCSQAISCLLNDFDINKIIPVKKQQCINGFGKSTTLISHSGTSIWNTFDKNLMIQTITIPNLSLTTEGGTPFLSPQHWAQENENLISCIE